MRRAEPSMHSRSSGSSLIQAEQMIGFFLFLHAAALQQTGSLAPGLSDSLSSGVVAIVVVPELALALTFLFGFVTMVGLMSAWGSIHIAQAVGEMCTRANEPLAQLATDCSLPGVTIRLLGMTSFLLAMCAGLILSFI